MRLPSRYAEKIRKVMDCVRSACACLNNRWQRHLFQDGKKWCGEDSIHKDTTALQKDLVVKLTPEFCKAVRKYNSLSDFKDGFAVVEKGEKWGVIDTEGKEVVPCVYDVVASFYEELAAVCKNDKWGFVNTKGKLAIPCTYELLHQYKW